MKLELRVVDRGGSRSGGLIPLRDVYLRDGGETLLYQCGVSAALVDRIVGHLPGVAVRTEALAGVLDGTGADDDGPDTDLYEPDTGNPVG